MKVTAFIPKEHPDLPDSYGAVIYYADGKFEEFDIVSHNLSFDGTIFEYITSDDHFDLVPMSFVKRIRFDKRFSQVVDIKRRQVALKGTGTSKK